MLRLSWGSEELNKTQCSKTSLVKNTAYATSRGSHARAELATPKVSSKISIWDT